MKKPTTTSAQAMGGQTRSQPIVRAARAASLFRRSSAAFDDPAGCSVNPVSSGQAIAYHGAGAAPVEFS